MDIEQRALEAIRAVISAYHTTRIADGSVEQHVWGYDAVKRAFSAFADARDDAFRQEVSEALMAYFGDQTKDVAQGHLGRFIIQPKPDPLGDVIREIWPDDPFPSGSSHLIRAALKSRGLEIREVGNDRP